MGTKEAAPTEVVYVTIKEFGELVKRYLIKAGCGVKLLQSHNLYGESAGENIIQSANDWEADIFVSIYCNAFDKTVRGAETLVYDLKGEGYGLGRCIHAQLYLHK